MALCRRGNPFLTPLNLHAKQNCWRRLWFMIFAVSSLHDSPITQKSVHRGLNHCEGTHGITESASHAEKSQCARNQHRSVVQNMPVWVGESGGYETPWQYLTMYGPALASTWKEEISVFVRQAKNPSFHPAFIHPLLSFMTKSLFCLLFFVLCFVSSSQVPHRGTMQNVHSAARSFSAPWEWVLYLLLACSVQILSKHSLAPI